MPWLEIMLPLYALIVVVVYYRLDRFHVDIADEWIESLVLWAVWIVGGALGGVLALAGIFLAACLLYSPIYLASNFRRAMNPGVWSDPRESRFYLCCFVLLCALIALAVWNLEISLVVFTILAGSAQFLWRLIL
jgi:hypothetical protein